MRDHVERTWRPLDSCDFRTVRHVRVSRVECPVHKAKVVQVSRDDPAVQFTALLERRCQPIHRPLPSWSRPTGEGGQVHA